MKTIASLFALACLTLPRMQAAQEPLLPLLPPLPELPPLPDLPPLPELPPLPPLPERALAAEHVPVDSAQDPDDSREAERTARDLARSARLRAVESRDRAERARDRAERSRVRAEARAQEAQQRAERRRTEAEQRRARSTRGRTVPQVDLELLAMLERLEQRLDALEGRGPAVDSTRRKCAPSRIDVRVVRPRVEGEIRLRTPAPEPAAPPRLERRLDSLEKSLRAIEQRLEEMTPCRCGEKKSGDSVSRLERESRRQLGVPAAYAAR